MTPVRVDHPAAVLLLVAVPVAVALAARRALPRGALVLRLAVLAALALAAAHPAVRRPGGDLTVVFAVDVSDSVRAAQRQAAERFVRDASALRRPGDRIGLVVFGADAVVEEVPSADPLLAFVSRPPGHATDLAAAIRAALGVLPPEGSRRVVILSDGRPTRGDLAGALALARAAGVEVSAVSLDAPPPAEVLVDAVTAPTEVRVGERFDVAVALEATAPAQVDLAVSGPDGVVARRSLQVPAGRSVVRIPQQARREGTLLYAATIAATPDTSAANNRAEAAVRVRGQPVVWYVASAPGPLGRWLEAAGVRVRGLAPQALPAGVFAFAEAAAVVLDDVPATDLSPAQLGALRDYVERAGGGLVVVGGPHSYGVGGYAGTPLEDALPVAMDVRHRLAMPSLAIVLVIDTSGSMGAFGQQIAKVDLAKETAQAVIDLLGERDIIGVIAFDQDARWLAAPTEARHREQVMDQVARLVAGGGTNMYPALRLAYDYLRTASARVRHVIVLSDGQTDPGDFQGLVSRMAQDRITVTAVAIGTDADESLMRSIARWGGGRYYAARDVYTIPQILTAEALIASRAYLVEEPFVPRVARRGLADGFAFPPLRGYVATAPKAAATVHLVSAQEDPVLATWQRGLGRAVAYTSDATDRWASAWMAWPDAARFFTRLVRWALRDEDDDLTAVLDTHTTPPRVVVDAVTADGEPVDGLQVRALLDGPAPAEADLVQTGPGRYEGAVDLAQPGAYALTVAARDRSGTVRVRTAGVVVPASPELRPPTSSPPVLAQVVEATGGRLLASPREAVAPGRGSPAAAPAWPALTALAVGLFAAEVTLRRLPVLGVHLTALAASLRARLARTGGAQEEEEDRQYAEADRWALLQPPPEASASMQQAARLYIAKLKAQQDRPHGRGNTEE
ncbi:MAG: VWA domain-containing protein [Armatimonadota bacterium]|nr:VWA domain-containing protein [Armatimonadota bacterium]MDR7402788.1 VWA domain-containing protein [Armatimonadota bacterium]MDR7437039.1 VWA domain-containing protein [Armatimonadota bacterium]MDR7472890.1 VWA domain-containing protein [Armatimonadota bacterium]MDR7507220.1 VWA domain-containing protein [Armatimonadota bacterium]